MGSPVVWPPGHLAASSMPDTPTAAAARPQTLAATQDPSTRATGLTSRRACLIAAAALPLARPEGALAAADGGDWAFTRLDEALRALDRLSQGPRRTPEPGTWNWPQTLQHLAQSIEFSMRGFPESKPAWFQATLGAAAFGFFRWRGRMTHGLTEPIPGAPELDAAQAESAAVARLQDAITHFLAWNGPLAPHFAYGELDKAAYEQAHAMHVAEHLAGFTPRG